MWSKGFLNWISWSMTLIKSRPIVVLLFAQCGFTFIFVIADSPIYHLHVLAPIYWPTSPFNFPTLLRKLSKWSRKEERHSAKKKKQKEKEKDSTAKKKLKRKKKRTRIMCKRHKCVPFFFFLRENIIYFIKKNR